MKTGIVKDRKYLEHNMGAYHVENPKRLESIYQMIEKEISFSYLHIPPQPAKEEHIQLIHTPSYFKSIKETSGKERVILDSDTSTSPESFQVALLAAGGVLKAIDFIMEQKAKNAFALIRPPGHHAEASRAMGFCIFNNIAVGAQYLLKKYKLNKILIVDWDLHHGNGTQHSFENTNKVLYFSTHQYPYYPGTGHYSETGINSGEGFTVNIPLSPGKSDEDYLYIYSRILSPITSQYKPDFILVSAGFDPYPKDPLGGMNLTGAGFGSLTHELVELAQNYCEGKIVLVLEGGYNPQGLQEGVKHVLLQLAGEASPPSIKIEVSSSLEKEISPVLKIQRNYWKL